MAYISNFWQEILHGLVLPKIQAVAEVNADYIADLSDLHREYVEATGSLVPEDVFRNWCRVLKIGMQAQLVFAGAPTRPTQTQVPEPSLEGEDDPEPVLSRPSGAASGRQDSRVVTQLHPSTIFRSPPSETPIPIHELQARRYRDQQRNRGQYRMAANPVTGMVEQNAGFGGVLEPID